MILNRFEKSIIGILLVLYLSSVVIWHSTNITILFWIITLSFTFIVSIKFNYSYSRIPTYLFVFFNSLFGDTNYVLYFAILDFIVSFLVLVKNRGVFRLSIRIILPWVLMVCVGIISGLFFASDSTSSVSGIEIYLLLTLILISSDISRTYGIINPYFVANCILIVNALLLLLFWINNYDLVFSVSRGELQILGTSGLRSNTLAGIIIVFLTFVLFTKAIDKFTIVFKGIIIVLDGITLLFLQSRGSYVAIFAVLLLSEITFFKNSEIVNKTRLTSDLLCFLSIALILIIPKSRDFINTHLFSRFVGAGDISNGRFEIYSQTINLWKKHPLIGNGFLQFYSNNISTGDPHNFILGYLASVGIIGTLFFLLFLFFLLSFKSDSIPLTRTIKFTLVSQIIHGLFEPVLTTNLPLALFIIFVSYLISLNSKLTNNWSPEIIDKGISENRYYI